MLFHLRFISFFLTAKNILTYVAWWFLENLLQNDNLLRYFCVHFFLVYQEGMSSIYPFPKGLCPRTKKESCLSRMEGGGPWLQPRIRLVSPGGLVQGQERWVLTNRAVNTQLAAQRRFGQNILGASSLQLTRLIQGGEEWLVTWSFDALRVI